MVATSLLPRRLIRKVLPSSPSLLYSLPPLLAFFAVFPPSPPRAVTNIAVPFRLIPASAIDYRALSTVNHARPGWTTTVNRRFAGLSLADARGMMGTHLAHTPALNPAPAPVNSSAIPAAFDARTAWPGCIGPIRDQQQCVAFLHCYLASMETSR